MEYQIHKMATFIKFTRLEHSISQRQLSKLIYVSHGMINNIESVKLLSLDQHLDNIFDYFELNLSKYTDQDEEMIQKVHHIIYQTIHYELPSDNEETLEDIYFDGIENTYLFLYYQLVKTCLYARQYKHDIWLEKYFSIFDILIYQFDDIIQQYYFVLKYSYYKEKRMFALCDIIALNFDLQIMDDGMKGLYYHVLALRTMYEGNMSLEFEYIQLAKTYCKRSGNERRLISLVNIECDIYEKLGNMTKVIELFKASLVKMEEIGFMNLEYVFLSNLGIAYNRMNDFHNAIYHLNLSLKVNDDNLDLFYLVYSYMKIEDKKSALELLKMRYRVKCFSEVFYDLLDWCYQTLKRPYTKKCEYILQMIYKRHYKDSSLNTKKLILKLLMNQYEYQGNYFLMSQSQKELIKIMEGKYEKN